MFFLLFTTVVIPVTFLNPILCLNDLNINLKICKLCKITHAGVSFSGSISKTSRGLRCQSWASLGKFNITLNDEDFPERSIEKARNYCRNPTKDENGPWCYAVGNSAVKQQCDVPLCINRCRVTGPGVEYSGTTSSAIYRKCERWDKDWRKLKVRLSNGEVTFGVNHSDDRFPDKQVGCNSSYCRNPDGSLGGPWCYTESSTKNVYVKSYCDIPMLDERDNEFMSKQCGYYSHFVSYQNLEPNITFAVRLWNPDLEHKTAIKILLSTLSVPTSKQNMHKWGTAVELTISNYGTGVTIGNDSHFLEPINDILKATEYTTFVITWKDRVLNLFTSSDSTEPVYVETLTDSSVLENDNSIRYLSVSGDEVMWVFPFPDDDTCQEHTTFLPSPQFTWKLRQDGVQFYVELSVRSYHSAFIFLTCDPYNEFPRFSIQIGFQKTVTEVFYQPTEKMQFRVATSNFLIGYWSWTRLRIVLLGDVVQVMRQNEGRFVPLFTWSYKLASSLRWFSIASNRSLTHWALFCRPPDLPIAYPPNCALTSDAMNYKGDQWVSYSGLPCLPWFAIEPRFYEGEAEMNYCRNFKSMRSSPWCYVQSSHGIRSELCNIRKCNAVICKKSGTANDYVGDLAVTKSNRTCKKWPRSFLKLHKHGTYAGNFFEGNYCRNPSRDVGGAWCFTTDSALKKDLCNVKDCDKRESRIVLTNHKGDFRYTYIIPKWRDLGDSGGLHFALKRWDPTVPEGIVFKIFSLDKSKYLSLYIGSEYNEKLILRFMENKSNNNLLLARKIFPHIIPGGKWRDFRLQMLTGRIRLGYETEDFTILDWKASKPHMMFNPSFISYESIGHDVVGVYFPHLECHVENTSSLLHSRIYPITWQSDVGESSYNFTLYLRGIGIAIIPLVHFPSPTDDYLVISINNIKKEISLEKNSVTGSTTLCIEELSDDHIISDIKWNRYDIFCKNNSLHVLRNNIQLMKWESLGALVYYFFSVAAQFGWLVWTANCSPPDIDKALQNGGWSPWSNWYCSVSCGKGVGYRQRKCINPEPSIFGTPCLGNSMETGFCNNFQCGQVSPMTYNLIRKNLQTHCVNIVAEEGDNITFESPMELIKKIKIESPGSQIIWMHEGIPLKSKTGKYFLNNSLEVSLKNISQVNNGLYVCVVKSNAVINTPIKVVVLAVQPRHPDVIVYNGSSLELTCLSSLPTIYANLWLKWYLNDELFVSADIASKHFTNNLKIPIALWNHSGKWKCVMEQTELNMRWVVQIHQVLVTIAPSMFTTLLQGYASLSTLNLMQCAKCSQMFCMTSVLCVIFLLVCGILIGWSMKNKLSKGEYKKISCEDHLGTSTAYQPDLADTNANVVPQGNKMSQHQPDLAGTEAHVVPQGNEISHSDKSVDSNTDDHDLSDLPDPLEKSNDRPLTPKYPGIKIEIFKKGEIKKKTVMMKEFANPKKGKDKTSKLKNLKDTESTKPISRKDRDFQQKEIIKSVKPVAQNNKASQGQIKRLKSKDKYTTYDRREDKASQNEIKCLKSKDNYTTYDRDEDTKSIMSKNLNDMICDQDEDAASTMSKDKYYKLCNQDEDEKNYKRCTCLLGTNLYEDDDVKKPKIICDKECDQDDDLQSTISKDENYETECLDDDAESMMSKDMNYGLCDHDQDEDLDDDDYCTDDYCTNKTCTQGRHYYCIDSQSNTQIE